MKTKNIVDNFPPNGAAKVVSVSVVLTQIEPSDACAALSLAVVAARGTMGGVARASAALVQMGYLVGASAVLSNPSVRGSQRFLNAILAKDDACPNNKDNFRQRGKAKAQRIMASGNGLRHFLLEFVLEDGARYTMEKLVRGAVLYEGTSPRRNHCTVWTVPLDSTHLQTKKKQYLCFSDLQQICREENSCPYSFFRNNCKRFSWSVLTRILCPETFLQLQSMPWNRKTVLGESNQSPSYSKFRDACQRLDMHTTRSKRAAVVTSNK